MQLLLQNGGDSIQVTGHLLKIAAQNPDCGKELLELFFDQYGDEVHITSGIVEAAAKNTRSGWDFLTLLFSKMSDETKITQDVVKAAAGNLWTGKDLMENLIDQGVRIGVGVLEAAASNCRQGPEILHLLYEERKDEVLVTATVLTAAVENHQMGSGFLPLLLSDPERHAAGLCITDDVVIAAVRSWWSSSLEKMELLLDWRPEEVHITMEVQMAIIRNERQGRAIMMLLTRL
jgi:hypothetical protein